MFIACKLKKSKNPFISVFPESSTLSGRRKRKKHFIANDWISSISWRYLFLLLWFPKVWWVFWSLWETNHPFISVFIHLLVFSHATREGTHFIRPLPLFMIWIPHLLTHPQKLYFYFIFSILCFTLNLLAHLSSWSFIMHLGLPTDVNFYTKRDIKGKLKV